MEDLKWLAEKLPETVSGELEEAILSTVYDERELGDSLILYSRESVEWGELAQFMEGPINTKRSWGARCTCKNCGEDFFTGYIPGGKRKRSGIMLGVGEDGSTYAGKWESDEPMVQIYHDGDEVLCPMCWEVGELTPRRELKNGRTYGILQAEVQNIEGYTTVLYWMVRRFLDDEGGDHVCATPRDALVIDRDGRLQRFIHTTHGQFGESDLGEWRRCGVVREPGMIAYYNWGACNNRQVGAWVYDVPLDLTGTTGEKSALGEYIRRGGQWPGLYLRLWQQRPNVENLMLGGFSMAVIESVERAANAALGQGARDAVAMPKWCNWNEVKPHRMVGMTKEQWRRVKLKGWGVDKADLWDLWRREECSGPEEMELCVQAMSVSGVRAVMEMRRAGWAGFDPMRVAKYMRKHDLLCGEVSQLIDYRKMMHQMQLAETEETLWPRDFHEAHDRVAAYKLAHLQDIYEKGFSETKAKYRALEWTDGELRIVVPCIEEELKQEGRILRHCVGTYGHGHVNGRPIFFVRKYRRPERSYYTLNIDMTGAIPKEIQLHGYGNERHGDKKQYSHGIPQKVRDFVDRWEREVLTPWFYEQKRKEKAEKKGKKEKTA